MNFLDYNIPEDQVKQLRHWRTHFRQVGHQVGRPEWNDQQEILRYLHKIKQPTFFTRDLGFFKRQLCHSNYCLVIITGSIQETSLLFRKLLRHADFDSKAKREGKVIKLTSVKVSWWEIGQTKLKKLTWSLI